MFRPPAPLRRVARHIALGLVKHYERQLLQLKDGGSQLAGSEISGSVQKIQRFTAYFSIGETVLHRP